MTGQDSCTSFEVSSTETGGPGAGGLRNACKQIPLLFPLLLGMGGTLADLGSIFRYAFSNNPYVLAIWLSCVTFGLVSGLVLITTFMSSCVSQSAAMSDWFEKNSPRLKILMCLIALHYPTSEILVSGACGFSTFSCPMHPQAINRMRSLALPATLMDNTPRIVALVWILSVKVVDFSLSSFASLAFAVLDIAGTAALSIIHRQLASHQQPELLSEDYTRRQEQPLAKRRLFCFALSRGLLVSALAATTVLVHDMLSGNHVPSWKACDDGNCEICRDTNTSSCRKCKAGFAVVNEASLACPEGQKSPDEFGNCDAGYFRDGLHCCEKKCEPLCEFGLACVNGVCKACEDGNCEICSDTNTSSCRKCKAGFVVVNEACVACPEGQRSPDEFGNCDAGYFRDGLYCCMSKCDPPCEYGLACVNGVCKAVYPRKPAYPRRVRIYGQQFVLSSAKIPLVLGGPNVVVKGPPYIPSVSGSSICRDVVNADCIKTGTCKSCATFNQADADHIKSLGWNFIRLGVVWAGAQPRDEPLLDPDFLMRLHALLYLTDANGIHVMLDNHGDMVGSAGCGNGVPMWFQKKAAPELIGKPLETASPFSWAPASFDLDVTQISGYDHCGKNWTRWAKYAGDPNYNIKNECCLAMNEGDPTALGYTTISQKTMEYLLKPGVGRDDFVRYWTLLVEAVKGHPSAFAAELMNVPMTIHRKSMFDTWRACAEAINRIIPDMSISIADIGNGVGVPLWINALEYLPYVSSEVSISSDTINWIKLSNNTFYAFHGYSGHVQGDIQNVLKLSKEWNLPTFLTEGACDSFNAAKAAGISHSYWQYSCYCNTGRFFGNRNVPRDTFGACILGWSGGDLSKCLRPVSGTVSV